MEIKEKYGENSGGERKGEGLKMVMFSAAMIIGTKNDRLKAAGN